MMWVEWAWLIPVFPLVAFPLILFFGKKIPKGGGLLAIVAVALSFILSLLVLVDVTAGNLPHAASGGEGAGGGEEAAVYESSMTWAGVPGMKSPRRI